MSNLEYTSKELLDWAEEMSRRLRTQDNAITDEPMFTVQQKRRIYGFDEHHTDNFCWVSREESSEVTDTDELAALEQQYEDSGEEPEGYTRTGYLDVWEHVTTCFTQQGCKDYLAANGHNLCEPRIYVESGHRNAEWIRVRSVLLNGSIQRLVTDVLRLATQETIMADEEMLRCLKERLP